MSSNIYSVRLTKYVISLYTVLMNDGSYLVPIQDNGKGKTNRNKYEPDNYCRVFSLEVLKDHTKRSVVI